MINKYVILSVCILALSLCISVFAEDQALVIVNKEKLIDYAKTAILKKYPDSTEADLQFVSLQYSVKPTYDVLPGTKQPTNMTEHVEVRMNVLNKTKEKESGKTPLIMVKRTTIMEVVDMNVMGEVLGVKGRTRVTHERK